MAVCKKKVTHVRQRGYIVRVMIKLKIKIKIRVYEIKLPLYIDSVDCLGEFQRFPCETHKSLSGGNFTAGIIIVTVFIKHTASIPIHLFPKDAT